MCKRPYTLVIAENLDAGFAKSSGKEDKYTGSALKNFFLNKLYADSFSGKKRGGGGGDASGGIAGYVARTPEEYDQVTKIHNTNVMDPQHRRIQEHLDNETERGEIRDSGRSQRDAQRTQLHVESTARLLREGTQNGGLSSYIDPGASTPKQDRQNSAAFSYAKPFKP